MDIEFKDMKFVKQIKTTVTTENKEEDVYKAFLVNDKNKTQFVLQQPDEFDLELNAIYDIEIRQRQTKLKKD